MRLKEKNLLKKFAATLKKFSAQGAKKVEYGTVYCDASSEPILFERVLIRGKNVDFYGDGYGTLQLPLFQLDH